MFQLSGFASAADRKTQPPPVLDAVVLEIKTCAHEL